MRLQMTHWYLSISALLQVGGHHARGFSDWLFAIGTNLWNAAIWLHEMRSLAQFRTPLMCTDFTVIWKRKHVRVSFLNRSIAAGIFCFLFIYEKHCGFIVWAEGYCPSLSKQNHISKPAAIAVNSNSVMFGLYPFWNNLVCDHLACSHSLPKTQLSALSVAPTASTNNSILSLSKFSLFKNGTVFSLMCAFSCRNWAYMCKSKYISVFIHLWLPAHRFSPVNVLLVWYMLAKNGRPAGSAWHRKFKDPANF